MKMFKNLLFELAKNNLKLSEVAIELKIPAKSLRQKLEGKKDFKISECLKIQNKIGGGNLCLDYLFKKI